MNENLNEKIPRKEIYKRKFIEEFKIILLVTLGFGFVTYFLILVLAFLSTTLIISYEELMIKALWIFPFFMVSYLFGYILALPIKFAIRKLRGKEK